MQKLNLPLAQRQRAETLDDLLGIYSIPFTLCELWWRNNDRKVDKFAIAIKPHSLFTPVKLAHLVRCNLIKFCTRLNCGWRTMNANHSSVKSFPHTLKGLLSTVAFIASRTRHLPLKERTEQNTRAPLAASTEPQLRGLGREKTRPLGSEYEHQLRSFETPESWYMWDDDRRGGRDGTSDSICSRFIV